MKYTWLVGLILLISTMSNAQNADTIFVRRGEKGWFIPYKAQSGDNLFSIARHFHVPPAILSDMNGIGFQQEIRPGTRMVIPLAAYNLLINPSSNSEIKPLYYKVRDEENIKDIVKNSGVAARTMAQWNRLSSYFLSEGQRVFVGWVLLDETNMAKPPVKTPVVTAPEAPSLPQRKDTVIVLRDTVAMVDSLAISEGELLYNQATNDGLNARKDKGTAVFFQRVGKSSNGIYFAFFNEAPVGSILKITNIGTGKTVYAKVIGPVPKTAQYHNSFVGISSDAKTELEVADRKAWCEISFAP